MSATDQLANMIGQRVFASNAFHAAGAVFSVGGRLARGSTGYWSIISDSGDIVTFAAISVKNVRLPEADKGRQYVSLELA